MPGESLRPSVTLWMAGAVWIALVGSGFALLMFYKATPAAATHAATSWPAESALERATDRPTLILFAHPRCPCTRASISELARLLAGLADPPRVYVAFILPRGTDREWTQTDLWQSAARLPGVRVLVDEGGREAERFSATTSGATLLYGAGGELLFNGGITSARGHEGDSFGQRRLVALLTGKPADRRDSPVFGCALRDAADKESQ